MAGADHRHTFRPGPGGDRLSQIGTEGAETSRQRDRRGVGVRVDGHDRNVEVRCQVEERNHEGMVEPRLVGKRKVEAGR